MSARPFPADLVIGRAGKMCVMEWVAFRAGDPPGYAFSEGACGAVSAYLRRLNDRMPDDATRTAVLRNIVEYVVGSRRDRSVERARIYGLVDAVVSEHLASALASVGEAVSLTVRDMPCIRDAASAESAWRVVRTLRPLGRTRPELAPLLSHAILALRASASATPLHAALCAADAAADAAELRAHQDGPHGVEQAWIDAQNPAWGALNVE